MTTFWAYFWPIVAAGMVLGVAVGSLALRHRRLWLNAIGIALALAAAALWHGPLGAAGRYSAQVEGAARTVLVDWEMSAVTAKLQRGPLTRRLYLSGPADDFQRGELVRILGAIPGIGSVTWSNSRGLPLIIEAALASLAGFLVGLMLAYLIELRRRHNAQWKW